MSGVVRKSMPANHASRVSLAILALCGTALGQMIDGGVPGPSAASNQSVAVEASGEPQVPPAPGSKGTSEVPGESGAEVAVPVEGAREGKAIRRLGKPEAERPGSPFALPARGLGGLGSLAVVLLAIAGLYWLARRWVPGARAADSGAMRVVARVALSPRQYAALVHIGRRLLVVGVSNERVNPLAEINDADEVAELLARCGLKSGGVFDAFLDKEQSAYERPEVEEDLSTGGAAAMPSKGAVQDLLRQVRRLQPK